MFRIFRVRSHEPRRFFSTAKIKNKIPDIFNPQKLKIAQQKRELKSKEAIIVEEIKSVKNHLNALEDTLHHIQKTTQELNQNFKPSEWKLKRDELKKMEKIFLASIVESILNGTDEVLVDDPSYGYDRELMNIFDPIFKYFGITYRFSQVEGQREAAGFLHFNFSALDSSKIELPVTENKLYDKWLAKIRREVIIKITSAKSEVKKDLLMLKENLYGYGFTTFKPCPAAFRRCSEIARENGLKLTEHENVITLEKDEEHKYFSYVS